MTSGGDTLSVCIMAGGVGERFWPLSRASKPKQLLSIVSDKPMITDTADRNQAVVPAERIYVITTQDQASDIRAALPFVPPQNVLAEPYGRNTAPCIGLVCALLAGRDPETVLAVIPADHCIPDIETYAATIRDAARIAEREQALVTIGITPRFPETGYGYIVAKEALPFDGETEFSRVARFVEKPPREKAEQLIETGNAFWNAGMFVFRVQDMLEAFQRFLPDFYPRLTAIREAVDTPGLAEAVEQAYAAAPAISIDYAIMEKADNVIVAHGTFTWDDVGSWTAVSAHWPTDEQHNATRGSTLLLDSDNCIVGNYNEGIIGLVGVRDLIVVRTGDALLICDRARAQDVKKLVAALREKPSTEPFTT